MARKVSPLRRRVTLWHLHWEKILCQNSGMIKSEQQKQSFPATRMRRPRLQEWGRRLVRETKLDVDNLIWPLFIREGNGALNLLKRCPA